MGNPTGFFDNAYPYTDFHELNLSWIIEKMKNLLDRMDSMEDWKREHEAQYQQLKDLYDDVMSGNFPPSIVKAFEDWMYENAIDLVGRLVKHVYFGLTNNGYFCAYIPANWQDITFDTIDDWDSGLFGHLLLMYD